MCDHIAVWLVVHMLYVYGYHEIYRMTETPPLQYPRITVGESKRKGHKRKQVRPFLL